jgi:hypothetical protein
MKMKRVWRVFYDLLQVAAALTLIANAIQHWNDADDKRSIPSKPKMEMMNYA